MDTSGTYSSSDTDMGDQETFSSEGGGVTIKGTKEGLLVTLGDSELASLLEELQQRLRPTVSFFRGGQVILDVRDRTLNAEELARLDELLGSCDMALRSVVARDASTRRAARTLGLRAFAQLEPTGPKTAGAADQWEGSEGLLIRRTVRSGQVVRHAGHVVVIGDVNAGAEVIAGGDVVIWGTLRGVVHAGAMGDDHAIVCAIRMLPLQLRIGNYVARPPEDGPPSPSGAESAVVRDDKIVAEPWS